MTEQQRIEKANQVIDSYATTLKDRLADMIAQHKHEVPGGEFWHLNFQYHEKDDNYTLSAVFLKPKE